MSVVKLVLTITCAIGSVNATASRLADVMSVSAGYEAQLHSNVTAYDICMYLATGYQYNQLGTHRNITTEAYDDLKQGVAKILVRYVNDEYDNTTEALDSFNKTQRVVNFNVSECDGITDEEVIDWYFPSTAVATDYTQYLDRGRRGVVDGECHSQGENCRGKGGKLDPSKCHWFMAPFGRSCACAEYGENAAACQTAWLIGNRWYTGHHEGWGEVTALMIRNLGRRSEEAHKLVGYIVYDSDPLLGEEDYH